MSSNHSIRNAAVYILWKLEWHFNLNHYNTFKKKKSILINYKVHLNTINMMKKYSHNAYSIQQGFALLAQIADGNRSTCIELLDDGIIDVLKININDIYSLNGIKQSDLDLLKSTSKFLANVTNKGECLRMALTSKSSDILTMVLKLFKLIEYKQYPQLLTIIYYTLKSILNMSNKLHNISIHDHLWEELIKDNGTLLRSVFNFVNFKESYRIRKIALHIIHRIIARRLELAQYLDYLLDPPEPSLSTLINQYKIMKYIKQFIHNAEESMESKERIRLLQIFNNIIGYQIHYFTYDTKYYNLLLLDNDIMNIIYNSLKSRESNENLNAIRFINSILIHAKTINKWYSNENYLNEYISCIKTLLHWKEGLMIEGICVWFDNYNTNSSNKSDAINKVIIMEMFNLLEIIVLMIKKNWIQRKYIQHKLNKNELIPSLIKNKFVEYDFTTNNSKLLNVNSKLLRKIIQKHDIDKKIIASAKDDILFITKLCEEKLGFILIHK